MAGARRGEAGGPGTQEREAEAPELDAEIRQVCERMAALGGPAPNEQSIAEARAAHDAIAVWASGPGQEVARVEDCSVPGPGGPIPARVYWPAGAEPPGGPGMEREAGPHGCTEPSRTVAPGEPLPVIVYFHGGGWTMGSIDSFDCVCRALANAAGALLVSAGYRLAPEHPYPAAADDAEATLAWVVERAAELGADPDRVAVAGDSAGGNLAVVAARRARDAGGPTIRFQALVYPVVDEHRHDDDDGIRWIWEAYLGTDPSADGDFDAAPLHADLTGMPPALVLCAEQDPLRPDGEAYAAALRDAGVDVEHRTVQGTVHGFWRWQALCGVSRRTVDDVGAALRAAL
jgi:acetyl esterase